MKGGILFFVITPLPMTDELYSYHVLSLIHTLYEVEERPTVSLEYGEEILEWSFNIKRRSDRVTRTIHMVQGGSRVDYSSLGTMDALINLNTKQNATLATAPYKPELKSWRDTTQLTEAVSSTRASKRDEGYITATVRAFLEMFKAAFDNAAASTYRILCVCNVGKERSVVFVVAAMTIVESLRVLRGEPTITEIDLGRLKQHFMTAFERDSFPPRALVARCTPIFMNVAAQFPKYFVNRGALLQGNKRALEITPVKHLYCARCDKTNILFFNYCKESARVFCHGCLL